MWGTRAVAPTFNEKGLFHPPCPLASRLSAPKATPCWGWSYVTQTHHLPYQVPIRPWGGLWREKGCNDGKGTVISSRGAVSRCRGLGGAVGMGPCLWGCKNSLSKA